MSANIVIIDYKMGNLRSVQKAFEHIGESAIISNDLSIIQNASKLVLPGVGAFKDAMHNLRELGLIDLLNEEILEKKKPFLGICLGMQLIATKSYEFGETKGLGWIDAEITRFADTDLKIPHVGWNSVQYANPSPLFESIPDNSDFYFVHSYYFDANRTYATGICDYGTEFIASVQKENIYATQFHPEKSQTHGLRIIENFSKLPIC
ncbi:MAG: imidazole glycerol phosphate synthase subunit HisH [Sulfuricurvum sp.]|nr:imidazole glycerol phosphate synthase subunit HisH [Sulfuricurvum sp.]